MPSDAVLGVFQGLVSGLSGIACMLFVANYARVLSRFPPSFARESFRQIVEADHARLPFGKYLRTQRKAAFVSQARLAKAIGVSHSYVSEVELGQRPPFDPRLWPAIVKMLPGTSIADLQRAAAQTRPLEIDLSKATAALLDQIRGAAVPPVRPEKIGPSGARRSDRERTGRAPPSPVRAARRSRRRCCRSRSRRGRAASDRVRPRRTRQTSWRTARRRRETT